MIKSVLMRRLYAAVLAAVLLVAVITWLVFANMSDSVFVNLRAADMLPRARSFAEIAARYIDGDVDAEALLSLVTNADNDSSSLLNAYAIITDMTGKILFASDGRDMNADGRYMDQINEVLEGKTVFTATNMRFGIKQVTIGVPVMDGETQTGVLILYMPEFETAVARSSMTSAVAVSICIAMPVVGLMVYFLLYRLIQPLRHMRDSALRMAGGNFDIRADDSISGEIGQLGASLNILARELHQSISDLTLEKNRLVQVLDSLSEGIAAVDRDGIITHINRSLGELFGENPEETDPQKRVIPFDEIWEAFDKARKTGESTDKVIKQGEKQIRCLISPVYDDNRQIAGAVGTFRDVSSEMNLERTRREYVANVSHEMRTPLTAMRGLIEPLRDGMVKDDTTRQRYYDIILRETLRLSRLINDIMELSRLQSGTTSIQREVFDPRDVVFDLGERYGAMANEHGLTLTLSDSLKDLPRVYSNPDRLEQILVILLDNAIKYTHEGGITVDSAIAQDKLLLKVRDTGLGISAENLPHIFDRFYKVDKAHSGMGSGLGLSIAKEVLAAMNESITVRSEEGVGTEFTFTVALAGGKQNVSV